ncbi:hypothetical protein [Microbacterium faecale]|nr:hypothetical protein [Microbacterium faecale]
MTTGANRQRQAWRELPEAIRLAATELLGAPVVTATTQKRERLQPGSRNE